MANVPDGPKAGESHNLSQRGITPRKVLCDPAPYQAVSQLQ
jgi:hypothetical protein